MVRTRHNGGGSEKQVYVIQWNAMKLRRWRQNGLLGTKYSISGTILVEVEQRPYLGIELGNCLKLEASHQIATIVNDTIAFQRRSIDKCSKEVIEKAYIRRSNDHI